MFVLMAKIPFSRHSEFLFYTGRDFRKAFLDNEKVEEFNSLDKANQEAIKFIKSGEQSWSDIYIIDVALSDMSHKDFRYINIVGQFKNMKYAMVCESDNIPPVDSLLQKKDIGKQQGSSELSEALSLYMGILGNVKDM